MNTDWVSSAQFTAPDSPLGKMKQRQQRQGCGMLVDQTSFFNLSRVYINENWMLHAISSAQGFRDWLRVYLRSQVDSLDRPYFKLVSPFSKWVGVFLEYRSALQVREPSAVVGAQSYRSVEHCWSCSKSWWLFTALRAWSQVWLLWTFDVVASHFHCSDKRDQMC